MDLLLERFMTEAGLSSIDVPTAALRLAQELARTILSGSDDPLLCTRRFEQLWIAADYASNMQGLGTMDDEVYIYFPPNSVEAREFVRKRLEEFANRPDAP